MQIISDKTHTVTYRKLCIDIQGFTVTESYADGKLISQWWSVKGGFNKTHKKAYSPSTMTFNYYDDISFLGSDKVIDYRTYEYREPTLITDWNTFKGLDHVICDWISMDGNIYRINDPSPISMWRHQPYSFELSNKEHDLKLLAKSLKSKSDWIRNVEIVDIPHYNQFQGSTKAVVFDYKLASKKDLEHRIKKDKALAKLKK